MIPIKIVVDIICGILFAWGGFDFLPARRFIMPVLLAVTFLISSHIWWLGLLVLPVIGTLCLGYRGSKAIGRGLWLGLQSFVIGIGAVLTHHLLIILFVPYVLISAILGGTLYNLQQLIGDFIFGTWLGSIIFFVH